MLWAGGWTARPRNDTETEVAKNLFQECYMGNTDIKKIEKPFILLFGLYSKIEKQGIS